jgi:hypothetical protein
MLKQPLATSRWALFFFVQVFSLLRDLRQGPLERHNYTLMWIAQFPVTEFYATIRGSFDGQGCGYQRRCIGPELRSANMSASPSALTRRPPGADCAGCQVEDARSSVSRL